MKHARWGLALALGCQLFVGLGCGGPSYGAPHSPGPYRRDRGPSADMMKTAERASPGSDDANYESTDSEADGDYAPPEPAAPPMQAPAFAKKSVEDTTTTPSTTKPSPRRAADNQSPILIYTADFTLAVYETQKTIDAVQSLAEKAGGYLSRRSDTSITVRIPADRFQDAVTQLQALGEVMRRNVSSEDVTAEFRDLEVQLKNAIAMRDRFAALLLKATTVEESLGIERELGRVTAVIERVRGRLKVLADLAAYSTITVDVQRKQSAVLQQGPFHLPLPWLNDLGLPRLMRL